MTAVCNDVIKIAFIGLGQMGRPMAENLIRAGFALTVHNRSQAVVQALVKAGATAATSPVDAVRNADIVMTCLLHPEQSREVYFGPKGILHGISAGDIVVDFATVEPSLSREIGAAVHEHGGRFLDAPVSGGPKGASAATLNIMVGGAAEDFTTIKPVLEFLGKKLFHLGPIGSGTTAKICNQMLTGVTHALVAEAMVLGCKAGIEPRALFEVLRSSSGQSNSLERAVPAFILPGRFEPAFALDGIIKDLECGIRTAKALGVRIMLAPIAQQLYIEASAQGHGRDDVAAVVRPMERIAGIEVRSSKE